MKVFDKIGTDVTCFNVFIQVFETGRVLELSKGERNGGVLFNQSYTLNLRLRPAPNFTFDLRPRYRKTRKSMWDALGDEGDNVFLVKVNYWLGL